MDDIIYDTAGVVLVLAGLVLLYLGWTTKEPQRMPPEEPFKYCRRLGGYSGNCVCQQAEECIHNDL